MENGPFIVEIMGNHRKMEGLKGKIIYKWRFLAGKIIYFYGPSIPWRTVSHNKSVATLFLYIPRDGERSVEMI